jgi:anti-sigma factor RsiW
MTRRNPGDRESVGKRDPHDEDRTAMAFPNGHPESTRLEAKAAGELVPEEARLVDAHLATCARCRSEVEGWALLFSELGELSTPAPSPDFAARVMAQVELRPPLGHRIADRFYGALRSLRGLRARPAPSTVAHGGATEGPRRLDPLPGVRHLTPAGIQDYLDGLLAARVRHRVEGHVATCGPCRREVQGWKLLVTGLETLPPVAPPAGFADRVMAQVQVAAVARVAQAEAAGKRGSLGARLGARVVEGAGRLLPSTRRGWLVAGGAAIAPAAGVVAAFAAVLLHPLLTFGDLFTFLRWRTFDVVGGLGSAMAAWAVESPIVFRLVEAATALAQASPAALGGAATLAVVLLGTATLVVYRNLIAPSLTGEAHVQRTS